MQHDQPEHVGDCLIAQQVHIGNCKRCRRCGLYARQCGHHPPWTSPLCLSPPPLPPPPPHLLQLLPCRQLAGAQLLRQEQVCASLVQCAVQTGGRWQWRRRQLLLLRRQRRQLVERLALACFVSPAEWRLPLAAPRTSLRQPARRNSLFPSTPLPLTGVCAAMSSTPRPPSSSCKIKLRFVEGRKGVRRLHAPGRFSAASPLMTPFPLSRTN